MPKRRDRHRRPGRSAPYREPKPRILIVTEGEVTEPQYFRGFQAHFRNPRVEIHIAREHGGPRFLVEAAKKLMNDSKAQAKREKDENLSYDFVWCVFDIDDHPHVPEAKQRAKDNGIDLAISNPSFELWLLLHFRKSPGMQHRTKVAELLKKHVSGYDKQVVFKDFAAGYDAAVVHATKLHEADKVDGGQGRNPTTGVFRLTELIRTH